MRAVLANQIADILDFNNNSQNVYATKGSR